MSEYTPTTEQVREAYVRAMRNAFIASAGEHREEFSRWLAEVERAAAVDAIENLTVHVGSEFFRDAGQVASLAEIRQWLRSCADAYRTRGEGR